jgi:hypothetical protein
MPREKAEKGKRSTMQANIVLGSKPFRNLLINVFTILSANF